MTLLLSAVLMYVLLERCTFIVSTCFTHSLISIVMYVYHITFVSYCYAYVFLRSQNRLLSYYYNHFMAVCLGLPGWAGTQRNINIRISWYVCVRWCACVFLAYMHRGSAIADTCFKGRMLFQPPNHQRQNTEEERRKNQTKFSRLSFILCFSFYTRCSPSRSFCPHYHNVTTHTVPITTVSL